jgi:hypothetical protein
MKRMTHREKIELYLAQGLTVSGGKGDKVLESAEHTNAAFMTTLQSIFKQQFGAQSQILNFLNAKLTNQVSNPQGFTPQALAAANTQATEGVARDFSSAQKATQEIEAARGGSTLPSGVEAQLTAGNANAAAQEESTAQNQIQLANAQQQQQNYWNAVGALSGTAQLMNPQSFMSGANNTASELSGLSEADSKAKSSGFFNSFANSFASGLGGGLGGVLSGNPGKG